MNPDNNNLNSQPGVQPGDSQIGNMQTNDVQPVAGQVVYSAPQAVDTPQPQVGAAGQIKPARKFGRFSLPVMIAGVVIVLAGGGAAAYFGYVVPNKPENIWKTSLGKTATAYDTLVSYEQNNKSHTTGTLKGNFKLAGEFATDGTIDAKIDSKSKNADIKFDIGAVTSRVNVEARMIGSANSVNPDIYIRAAGFKGLGSALGGYGPMLDGLDGQWISIDHTLLDNLESGALSGSVDMAAGSKASDLTPDDLIQIYKAVGDVNRQYIFTTDVNKSVLTVVKNVGKEKQDGRTVYHYQVGLHKQHTKDYANAMVDRLQNTPLSKMLDGKKLRDVVNMTDLIGSIDKMKDSDTADVYVDTGTKLIRSVKFTDSANKQNNYEIKVAYTGGDVVPVTLIAHEVDEDTGILSSATIGVSANFKKDTADINLDFDVPTGSTKGDKAHETGSFKLTAVGSADVVKVDKPSGAKTLNEIIGQMMGGSGADIDSLFGATGSEGMTTDYSTLLGDVLSL